MKDSHAPSARGASVKDDWRARLSDEKDRVFGSCVQQFETSYAIFSISLNEAIELRQAGKLTTCSQVIWMTAALCERLAEPLAGTLRALGEHAKHYGTMPNCVPLDPVNYQSSKGQRSARMNCLISRILLTQRSQFLHKISALQEMVEELGREFHETADELANGVSVDPLSDWKVLDSDHYDLNTCLREAIVLFKSFLVALPENQLESFRNEVRTQIGASSQTIRRPTVAIRHRRMTAIAGQ